MRGIVELLSVLEYFTMSVVLLRGSNIFINHFLYCCHFTYPDLLEDTDMKDTCDFIEECINRQVPSFVIYSRL